MLIQILGIGCPACNRMEQDVRQILVHHRLEARIERIKDPEAIAPFGVFFIPAPVVEDRVVMAGYRGKESIERIIINQVSS